MKLLWLDLETTGLEPNSDEILEIGIVEADFLEPFKALSRYSVVLHYSMQPVTEVSLDGTTGERMCHHRNGYMHDSVYRMHKASGLWDECDRSIHMLWQIENYLCSKYGAMVDDPDEKPILAGSSIHFDHSFIKHHMPKFNEVLSYRHYDTRTIQLFARSLGMPKIPKKLAHRALDDIDEAMVCGRQCAEWLVFSKDTSLEK